MIVVQAYHSSPYSDFTLPHKTMHLLLGTQNHTVDPLFTKPQTPFLLQCCRLFWFTWRFNFSFGGNLQALWGSFGLNGFGANEFGWRWWGEQKKGDVRPCWRNEKLMNPWLYFHTDWQICSYILIQIHKFVTTYILHIDQS